MHLFPSFECSICMLHLYAPVRSGPIFRQVSQKCRNCLLASNRHLPLCKPCGGPASPSADLHQFLHDYSVCFCSSFRAACLAPISFRICLFLWWKGNILVCVPASLFGQFNENINKAQTGEGDGGLQSLESLISILHTTTFVPEQLIQS